MYVAIDKVLCGLFQRRERIIITDINEAKIPQALINNGNKILVTSKVPFIKVLPRAKLEIIDPTYDSQRSEPIPAISPTLSPTLSAIVAGFLGSSSGIFCSILPTISAPTSAALV